MDRDAGWASPRPLAEIRPEELERPGIVFAHDGYLYRTTSQKLGHGGMGNCYLVDRRKEGEAGNQACVAKAFHSQYLHQLRTDEITRRDHEAVLKNMEVIRQLGNDNLLPIYVSLDIGYNHLTVTPRMAKTLRQHLADVELEAAERVQLILQALRGLDCLHRHGLLHRDFTLGNILADNGNAYLFDFDLALALDDVKTTTYKEHYQGRIFGSPGSSVPPEILDPVLMDQSIQPQLDIYAVGSAIFALFTDELPYGKTEDMWSLLLRISDGVVFDGKSRIEYPASVPHCLRPIIERCMERNPARRYRNAAEVISQLEARLPLLEKTPSTDTGKIRPLKTLRYGNAASRLEAVYKERRDQSLDRETIEAVDRAVQREGYELRRAVGHIRRHPVFMAAPDPTLLAQGRFSEANTYPKMVTAISLANDPDRAAKVDRWQGTLFPRLQRARQGLLTPLYRVTHDPDAEYLLLFSEYVEAARFGIELSEEELYLEEALGLGIVICRQVAQLHRQGLAHNNVCAASLLFKADRERRRVLPAMVGLVAPDTSAEAMADDVRRLGALVGEWVKPRRLEEAEAVLQSRLGALRERLAEIARVSSGDDATIDDLIEALSDGLAAVDYNFGVLRENNGDTTAYALLLVSLALFDRLWSD